MNTHYSEKILVVDDDPSLLAALCRQFRSSFNIVTTESAPEALRMLEHDGPFAVVVSDMRMPEMNGIQFLSKASEISPCTVRVMLTGNADVETAMHAVNEGNIFRFLVKPCHKDTMKWAFEAALEQHRLMLAERELLEKTLKGCVEVLADILAMVNPAAFSRTSRIQAYVRQITNQLGLSKPWLYELAASLSQIGCVTIPADTLAKFDSGAEMTDEEVEMMRKHPETGFQLLGRIPRLEAVSQMIRLQQRDLESGEVTPNSLPEDLGTLGGLMLKATIDFDRLILRGLSRSQAIGKLKSRQSTYHPSIINALIKLEVIEPEMETRMVGIYDLNDTMALAEDVRTDSGVLIASRGLQVNLSLRRLLENYLKRREVKKEIRVQIPTGRLKKEEHIASPEPVS
jgi:response regulator RpfG family c-di-GMP phosphodiesterase